MRTASARARLIAGITGLSLGVALLVAVEPSAVPAEAASSAASGRVIAPDASVVPPATTDSGSATASMMRLLQVTAAAPFTSTPVPVITGKAVIGQRLMATTARWTPAATTSRYAWLVDGVPVSGQTSTAYTVRAADAGSVITVAVTGSRSGCDTSTQTSSATAAVPTPVVAEFSAAPPPTIAGSAQVGFTLTARAGTWSPWPSFSYAWLRDGVVVPGRTASTFVPAPRDAGTQLTVTVTGRADGYTPTSRTSAVLAIASTGEGYDVVVVLGQSNAQGVGTGWDPSIDVSVPGAPTSWPAAAPGPGRSCPPRTRSAT